MNILRLAHEELRRADVLDRLVVSASQGDVDAFLGAVAHITWPGGWVHALHAVVPLGSVPGAIRDAFGGAWQGSASQMLGLRRTLTLDLLGQDALALDGLAVLLPPVRSVPMPETVYRIAPRDTCQDKHIGLWWTGERSLALPVSLATSAIHEWGDGDLVLLSAEAPATAVLAFGSNDLELLVDPRLLRSVRAVATLKIAGEDALAA